MMTKNMELQRANRVSVIGKDEGFVARFWRTHKLLTEVNSEQIGWTPQIDGLNKTAQRELFRVWVCENANEYGIEWDPSDKRSKGNQFPRKYDSDELLTDTMVKAVQDDIQEWVSKLADRLNKKLTLKDIMADHIDPVTNRNGRDVASKYMNGNWAYADVEMIVTVEHEGKEGYVTIVGHLVSGQLKKPDMTYTEFYEELIKDLPEIVPVKKDEKKDTKAKKSTKKDKKSTKKDKKNNNENESK